MTDIEVDQSGKIEDTGRDTVLAFSDDMSYAILIPTKVKRAGLEHLRSKVESDKWIYFRLFAAGLFLLLQDHLGELEQITVDLEYWGWGGEIKGLLLGLIHRVNPDYPKDKIEFRRIGRKSRAHKLALATYRRKRRADKTITREELLRLI